MSPTNKELSQALEWPYNAALINVPIMLISGEGGGDDWVVTGGYVMAWFMWQLQGDEEAAKAFIGENPEIMNNEMYQDQRSDFHK